MLKKLVIAITMVLVMSLAITGVANAKVFYLSLAGSNAGTATAPSGTSVMVINNASGVTAIPGMENFEQFDCAIQLESGMTVEGTPSVSGVSGTLRYKESMRNNQIAWDNATAVNVWNGIGIDSGVTARQQQVYPVGLGYIQWEWVSGISSFGSVKFIFKVLD